MRAATQQSPVGRNHGSWQSAGILARASPATQSNRSSGVLPRKFWALGPKSGLLCFGPKGQQFLKPGPAGQGKRPEITSQAQRAGSSYPLPAEWPTRWASRYSSFPRLARWARLLERMARWAGNSAQSSTDQSINLDSFDHNVFHSVRNAGSGKGSHPESLVV